MAGPGRKLFSPILRIFRDPENEYKPYPKLFC